MSSEGELLVGGLCMKDLGFWLMEKSSQYQMGIGSRRLGEGYKRPEERMTVFCGMIARSLPREPKSRVLGDIDPWPNASL